MATGLSGVLRGVHGDLRGTIIALSEEGWTPKKTSGGHIRLDHPDAAKPVFSASTPSDFRAPANLLRDCRGALRAPLHCLSDPISEDEAMSTLQAHKAGLKATKRRSTFIESAGQRVVDNITQAASGPKPQIMKSAAPKTRAAAPRKTPRPDRTGTKPRTEKREMKMTKDITAATGPIVNGKPAEMEIRKPVNIENGKPADTASPKAVTAVRASAPRLESDAIALGIRIGIRIANGEMVQVPITADMVGKTLIMERGETYWVDGTAPVRTPNAKKGRGRRNGGFNDAILSLLADLKGERVPVSMIADHMVERGFYKPKSAKPSVIRRLEQLSQEGRVSYRAGPGEPVATHLPT